MLIMLHAKAKIRSDVSLAKKKLMLREESEKLGSEGGKKSRCVHIYMSCISTTTLAV